MYSLRVLALGLVIGLLLGVGAVLAWPGGGGGRPCAGTPAFAEWPPEARAAIRDVQDAARGQGWTFGDLHPLAPLAEPAAGVTTWPLLLRVTPPGVARRSYWMPLAVETRMATGEVLGVY